MFIGKIFSGRFDNGCPFVRFGKGKEKLVILPPLNDAVFEVTVFPLYQWFLFQRFAKTYTVYIIGRKKRCPIGYTTRDMAHDYAEIFELVLGPSHVIGISLGAMIAQHLASEYPQYVKKLILIAGAHYMGTEGLEIGRRWIPWARNRMWKEIYEDSIALTYRGWYHLFCWMLVPWFSRKIYHAVKDPSDFIISGQAAMIHDAFDSIAKIKAPTMILAGTEDRFFPAPLFNEMAKRIPESELHLIKGTGHGVYEEHRSQCQKVMMQFLKQSIGPSNQPSDSRPEFQTGFSQSFPGETGILE